MAQFIKGKQIAQQTVTLSGTTGNVIISGLVDTNGNVVVGDYSPTSPTHLTNKEYVDAVAMGLLPHEPVMVVSTTNITRETLLTIDGYELEEGDRVLVAGQTNAAENGIFVATTGGTWSRAEDADGDPEHEISVGDFVFVRSGVTYASTGWVLARTDGSNKQEITPEVDTQEWFQIIAPGSYTADEQGLKLVGTEFLIDLDGNTLSQSASGLRLSSSVETVISTNVTNITSLSTAVSTETSLRTSADASLASEIDGVSTELSTESSVRASADTSLASEIDGVSTELSTESSVRASADTSLESAITSNVSSIDDIIDSISGTTADLSSLETAVSNEISDRISGDSSLASEIDGISTELSTESSVRASADTSLASEIDGVSTELSTESSVRASADTSLASEIDGVSTELSTESSVRASADTSLSTAISTEISDRISGDNSLEDEIITLSGATLDIETILGEGELLGIVGGQLTGVTNIQTALSVELSDSVDSIDTVLDAISGTTADLTSLETQVDQNISDISSESSIRASADTSLASEIDGVSTELSTESSVRASADTSLESAIEGLTAPEAYEQTFQSANAGDDDNVIVNANAFIFTGDLINNSVFVFLNGVKYRFTNTAGTGTTVFYADIEDGTGTTLFFNGVAAGFAIETDDEIILKYTAEQ